VARLRAALFLRVVTEHAGDGASITRRQRRGRCLDRRCLNSRSLDGRCRRSSCPCDWLLRIDQATGSHANPYDQREPEKKRVAIHLSDTASKLHTRRPRRDFGRNLIASREIPISREATGREGSDRP
jgi:hypothetical protein